MSSELGSLRSSFLLAMM